MAQIRGRRAGRGANPRAAVVLFEACFAVALAIPLSRRGNPQREQQNGDLG
jgi:hypothetical protein